GQAKIDADWTAGFRMEWEVRAYRSGSGNTQTALGNSEKVTTGTYATQSLSMRLAYWYLNSQTLGRIGVGMQNNAAEGILSTSLADPDGYSGTSAGYVNRDFLVRVKGAAPGNSGLSAVSFREVVYNRQGDGPFSTMYDRATTVRYDTPNFMGFTAATSW